MSVFVLYKEIEPIIASKYHDLMYLVRKEYSDIQHIKTTSINKNYMFNDQISNQFYSIINISKENFRSLINKYVKTTKNFDSLDPNNIMLLFLMRYSLNKGNENNLKMIYEIFLYKNFYPIFNNYFKYGVDESAFEYFKTTLSSKYELSKQENLYATVDIIGKRNLIKYLPSIVGNSEKDFLLLPVNTKTRLNQFVKELMRAYKPFIEKNKVHLNASRDLEDEEGTIYNDQFSNNNKNSLEYKNILSLSIINNEISDNIINYISNITKRNSKDDIKHIYTNIIKNDLYKEKLIDIFIENLDHRFGIDDSRIIKGWVEEINKHKPDVAVKELDKIIISEYPELMNKQKIDLVEKRKIIIFLLFIILRKNKN